MKLEYFAKEDMLYITMGNHPSIESEEIKKDFVFDFDESGSVIGIEIEHASKYFNIQELEIVGLPLLNFMVSKKEQDQQTASCLRQEETGDRSQRRSYATIQKI